MQTFFDNSGINENHSHNEKQPEDNADRDNENQTNQNRNQYRQQCFPRVINRRKRTVDFSVIQINAKLVLLYGLLQGVIRQLVGTVENLFSAHLSSILEVERFWATG